MDSNNLSEWAESLIDCIGDETLAVCHVVSWLEGNLGKLNLLTESCYSLDDEGVITPEMNSAICGVYSEMFICWYLNKQAIKTLGASGCDWVVMEGEDQGMIRRVSKTDQSKTYKSFAKDCEGRLEQLLRWYKVTIPQQVLYNDRDPSSASALQCPPCEYYSEYNPVWL